MQVAMEIREYPGAKVDYDKIKKKILLSEPPHAGELEPQVKFAKIWGGGKEQPLLYDICAYIKLCEKNLKVGSSMWDACSNLKVSPTEIPTKFVAACIKATAT